MARNDHFSAFAATYAEFRPTYPPALFAKIAELAPATENAWDCATGNGQAAVSLTDHFGNITATDVGAAMIENAQPHPQVTYAVGSAEPPPIEPHSIDAITVAQALHWFDRPTFWRTCKRVLKPNGVLAYGGYLLPVINPAVDAIVKYYHNDTVGRFWPPDREPLLNLYAKVKLPAPPRARRRLHHGSRVVGRPTHRHARFLVRHPSRTGRNRARSATGRRQPPKGDLGI